MPIDKKLGQSNLEVQQSVKHCLFRLLFLLRLSTRKGAHLYLRRAVLTERHRRLGVSCPKLPPLDPPLVTSSVVTLFVDPGE